MAADARSEALVAPSRFLVDRAPLGGTVSRIAEITTDALPAARFAGITLPTARAGRRPRALTAAELR